MKVKRALEDIPDMNMYQYPDEPYHNECFSDITDVKSDFRERRFFNCVFRRCRFERSDFSGCNFIDCQFTRCELYLVDVLNTGFRDAVFDECAIVGVEFSKCNASMLSFAFSRCVLDYSSFARTCIATTRFNSCFLRNVDFAEADLTDLLLPTAIFQLQGLPSPYWTRLILNRHITLPSIQGSTGLKTRHFQAEIS